MPDVFVLLGNDHAEIEKMLSPLEESLTHDGGVTEEIRTARARVARWLLTDLSDHERAEEEHLWPVVRERVRGGERLLGEALSQEHRAQSILARLKTVDPADQEFDDQLRQLIATVRSHIEFEETQVWPNLREVLTARQARELGVRLQQARKCAVDRGTTIQVNDRRA